MQDFAIDGNFGSTSVTVTAVSQEAKSFFVTQGFGTGSASVTMSMSQLQQMLQSWDRFSGTV